MYVVESARVLLHLIHGHDLISIRQEHDIPARVPGLGTVTGDHEPVGADNFIHVTRPGDIR
jgi:hypothetical protein